MEVNIIETKMKIPNFNINLQNKLLYNINLRYKIILQYK